MVGLLSQLLPLLLVQVLKPLHSLLLGSLPLLLTLYPDTSHPRFQEAWSQGKTMSRRRGEESCPFLDGVYVSVMRRFASTSFFSSKN